MPSAEMAEHLLPAQLFHVAGDVVLPCWLLLLAAPRWRWSRSNGDLRVAHFFAIHALQIFPLARLLLARTRRRAATQVGITCLFAVVYTAAVWWLFAQAMHGRPVLAY